MRTLILSSAVAALVFATCSFTSASAGEHQPHWTYVGKEGPKHWGDLSADFAACSLGHRQSPVDLTDAHRTDIGEIQLQWKPVAPVVSNNGHTIQAAAVDGNTTTFGGKTYALLQSHFHHPSEHTIGGQRAPLEAHFVNRGADGKLLVLGVMITEGAANPEIAKLWQAAPSKTGEAQAKQTIDLTSLVPAQSKFYRYEGSLTTPPCSEIVDWIVFADPITASREQIDTFAKLYPDNSRPLQQLHERTIVFGR